MEHKETGCQAPEGPILCVNNCGFFGSAATMNMCSKCHKDRVLKQDQAKLAASPIDIIINGSGSSCEMESFISTNVNMTVGLLEPKTISSDPSIDLPTHGVGEAQPKEGPSRRSACKKRVGLTGFSCRCGNIFCAMHRYSDQHSCPFDYRTEARFVIAKANPVVKLDKLDKI